MTFAATRLEHCLTDVSRWMSANRLKLNSEKTELVWVGSRYGHTPLGSGGPSLQLGTDTVAASDHVRVLGVTISSDLSLDKHVSNVCAKCFFWLRQLRRVRRSLDVESVKTLVHAFVTTRLDYCNSVLAGAPRSATDKLQRVLNAAARLVSGTRKFDRGLSRLLHVDLHWLDVPERVQYKLSVTVHRCQQHKAPQYLIDCVTPASDIASRQRLCSASLRSASRHQLLVLRYQLSSLGHRSFAVTGPTTWNSLSADLRDPTCSDESFRRSLKTFLFAKQTY